MEIPANNFESLKSKVFLPPPAATAKSDLPIKSLVLVTAKAAPSDCNDETFTPPSEVKNELFPAASVCSPLRKIALFLSSVTLFVFCSMFA